jgi:glucose-6-phosphate isomerase
MGSERKKTTGHFHTLLPGSKFSHAELYEVLSGTALYILQPIDDMSNTNEGMQVNKIILVKLEAGEKIVVPPNCSHCTVNYGSGPLVFSNLVLDAGTNDYGGIALHRGMGVYVLETDGQKRIVPNPSYDLSKTEIYEASVSPDAQLGTTLEKPVYTSFISDPDNYKYLRDPSSYIDIINNGLSLGKKITV